MFNNQTIDENTIISKGLALSKNFILGHTTTGAYHYVLGQIVPTFTSALIPGSSTLPPWQVAKNLQLGSQELLEGFMREFGSDLILKSAFKGGLKNLDNLASLGQGFDIQVRGFENNMYNVANIVQKLSKKASGISLNYGNSSSMTINFNEYSLKNNLLTNTLPKMITQDTMTNVIEAGLTSLIGK